MTQSEFEQCMAKAAIDPNVTVAAGQHRFLPHYDPVSREIAPCMAMVFNVTETDPATSVSKDHTVVVSYVVDKAGEAGFRVHCSDKFLEARSMNRQDAEARVDEAVSMLPTVAKKAAKTKMMQSYDSSAENGPCQFWTRYRRDKSLCSHTSTVLAMLRDDWANTSEKLKADYETNCAGSAPVAAKGDNLSLEELAFRVPVLFEGDRGSGKTTEARMFIDKYNHTYVEFGGHEGIEAPDLLGYLVPFSNKDMVWKDGPLTEAFRKARNGKVVLLMDEILRIPTRELSILLTALSPYKGKYRLRTGRILDVTDGVASEETLEVPVENLCVVATTNIGAEYAVDDIDPAVAERFIIIRKDTEVEQLREVLKQHAKAASLGLKTVAACVKFFSKMTEAHRKGVVARTPTTRTLARAIELSNGSANEVQRALASQSLLWVARTSEGQPVAEQLEAVKTLLKACFEA